MVDIPILASEFHFMDERKRKLAEYAATFCVNVASIGAGIVMFADTSILTIITAAVTLFIGFAILWRASK